MRHQIFLKNAMVGYYQSVSRDKKAWKTLIKGLQNILIQTKFNILKMISDLNFVKLKIYINSNKIINKAKSQEATHTETSTFQYFFEVMKIIF